MAVVTILVAILVAILLQQKPWLLRGIDYFITKTINFEQFTEFADKRGASLDNDFELEEAIWWLGEAL